MENLAWIILSLWIFIAIDTEKAYGEEACIRHPCNGRSGNTAQASLTCDLSRIMVSDVTDEPLTLRNHTVLAAVKRLCMGRSACNLYTVCPPESGLVVHYMCVDANQMNSTKCPEGKHSPVTSSSGHILSKNYPQETKQPGLFLPEYLCHWKIRPPAGHQVVIDILDIVTRGSNEECDAGLVVSGNSCQGQGQRFAPRILCGGEAGRRLVRCGNVDIKLRKSKIVYPLRFWLFFQVQPIGQLSHGQSSLPCLVSDVSSKPGTAAENKTSIFPGKLKKGNITEVLIILLSVISGISIVLLVILIVLCVRWRTLQFRRSEALCSYQDLSPGLQAHYEYISSLEPQEDKNRPELVDGYFEVADALPNQERGATPTSPAYAEVEQVAHFRRLALSSESLPSRANSLDNAYSAVSPGAGTSSPNQDNAAAAGQEGAESNNAQYVEVGSQTSSLADLPSKNGGVRPKRTVLERLKGVQGLTFGEKDKKLATPGDVSPKLYSSSGNKGPSARSLLKGKTSASGTTHRPIISRLFGSREDVTSRDIPDTASEAGSEPAYEVVEEFVPLSVSKQGIKAKLKPSNEQPVPTPPSTGPPSHAKNKRSNQKSRDKQQESPNRTNVYAHSSPKPVSQNPRIDGKAEKHLGEKKDKAFFFANQRNKTASPAKSNNASSTIPSSLGKKATIERQPPSQLPSSDSPSSTNSAVDSKDDGKNKNCTGSSPSKSSGTKNNNHQRTAYKDIPRSRGIVKNGIERFEKSSS